MNGTCTPTSEGCAATILPSTKGPNEMRLFKPVTRRPFDAGRVALSSAVDLERKHAICYWLGKSDSLRCTYIAAIEVLDIAGSLCLNGTIRGILPSSARFGYTSVDEGGCLRQSSYDKSVACSGRLSKEKNFALQGINNVRIRIARRRTGSPPKALMLVCTHWSPRRMSWIPMLPPMPTLLSPRKPSGPSR